MGIVGLRVLSSPLREKRNILREKSQYSIHAIANSDHGPSQFVVAMCTLTRAIQHFGKDSKDLFCKLAAVPEGVASQSLLEAFVNELQNDKDPQIPPVLCAESDGILQLSQKQEALFGCIAQVCEYFFDDAVCSGATDSSGSI